MKEIAIIGAGGLGREVAWLIHRINQAGNSDLYNIVGFYDDNEAIQGQNFHGLSCVGKVEILNQRNDPLNLVCAIANPQIRRKIVENLSQKSNFIFPSLIDPMTSISEDSIIGMGTIICANTVVSVDVVCGNFNIIDWNCTIGHDSRLEDFVTLYPNVNVSGNVKVAAGVELGTGTQIIQGLSVGANSVIGAGAVVRRDIPGNCVAVGVPARVVKKR